MSQLALRDCRGKITTHDVQHAPAHTRHTKCDTLGGQLLDLNPIWAL